MTTTTARASIFKTGIRCEVAQDLIGALIAHAAHELAQALDAQNPDAQRIAGLRMQQQQWRDRREALDHRDAAQIEAVIADLGPLARRLYAAG